LEKISHTAGESPLEALLRVPPAPATQGGGSLPLAAKASRSTNAKSGRLEKQEAVTLN